MTHLPDPTVRTRVGSQVAYFVDLTVSFYKGSVQLVIGKEAQACILQPAEIPADWVPAGRGAAGVTGVACVFSPPSRFRSRFFRHFPIPFRLIGGSMRRKRQEEQEETEEEEKVHEKIGLRVAGACRKST